MKFICTVITVEDMARARAFYEGGLGCQVKTDFGQNVCYEGDFAIHLRSHFRALIDGRDIAARPNSGELYFEDDELEPIAARLLEAGTEFVHPIREQPWRQRVFRVYDPDGNILEFGETMEGLCRRLRSEGLDGPGISAATGLPEEFVRGAIG